MATAFGLPAIEFDNFGIEEQPIPSISAVVTATSSDGDQAGRQPWCSREAAQDAAGERAICDDLRHGRRNAA